MGTVATVAKVHMSDAFGGMYMGVFELTLDTTTAGGLMTVDLTDYFDYVWSVSVGHSDAANFYYVEAYGPDSTTAVTATNIGIGISEAGADGAVLDLVASTDMSSAITGLKLVVIGKQAV